MNSRGQTWHVACSQPPTVARAYFNDVDEEFFRAGDDIADQRAQRSYSDLTEYEGMGPSVLRRAVDRIARARRALIIAGVFLAGGIAGFAIARVSADAPAAAAVIAESRIVEPPAAAAVPAPVAVEVAPPAVEPAPAAAEVPPPAVQPVAAKPVAAKPVVKPAKRTVTRRAAKPRPSSSNAAAPIFPY
jgi:hypothetical protein